jgi:hypothetical protein
MGGWEAGAKVTGEPIPAGQPLKIEVLDQVVMGNAQLSSLRDAGSGRDSSPEITAFSARSGARRTGYCH